jgi:hypothetical protein
MAELTSMAPVYLATTPNGKEIHLAKVKMGNKIVRKIVFQGGGQVPDSLDGMFSDTNIAQRMALKYVEDMKRESAKKKAAAQKRTQTKK